MELAYNRKHRLKVTVLKFDSLESTNTEAIEQAKRGAAEGLCIVADEQTTGRGRHGRTWISKKGNGLYFSIILRPQIASEFLPLITLVAAVAVNDTLSGLYNLEPDIKWSNDVLINERKIGGILAESTETPNGLAVVLGIGINITSSNFPKELVETATSIEEETGHAVDRDKLIELLMDNLDHFYAVLQKPNGPKLICDHWANRSTYFEGKAVRVMLENESFVGTTDGLEANGGLRVITESGDLRIIQAGDVESLRTNDDNTT